MAELMAIDKFEALFRAAAGIDIDKNDLRRLNDFINQKMHAFLLAGQKSAKMNGRDIIQVADLPITTSLQQKLDAFKEMDADLELEPILESTPCLRSILGIAMRWRLCFLPLLAP